MLRFWLIVFNAVGLPSHVAVVGERVGTEEFEDTLLLQSHKIGRCQRSKWNEDSIGGNWSEKT